MEVVTEVTVENALANDDGLDELQAVDTDAEVMPDLFVHVRRMVCDSDGNLRSFLRRVTAAIRWMAFVGVIGVPLASIVLNETNGAADKRYHRPLWEDGQLNHLRLLDVIYQMGTNFFYACSALFPAQLANAIRLEDGALARLGAGEKKVAANELSGLRRWPKLLVAVGVPFMLYGVGMLLLVFFMAFIGFLLIFAPEFREEFYDGYAEKDDDVVLKEAGLIDDPRVNCQVLCPFMWVFTIWTHLVLLSWSFIAGIPCALCWYYAMKVGSVLAKDDVIEVVQRVDVDAVSDDTVWSEKVATPTIRLATHTMTDLSSGFGRGTGIAAAMCWVVRHLIAVASNFCFIIVPN
jgi:hypothetical protein